MENIKPSKSRIVKLILLRQGVYYLIHFFLIPILLPIIFQYPGKISEQISLGLQAYILPMSITIVITIIIDIFRLQVTKNWLKTSLNVSYYFIFYCLTILIPILYITIGRGYPRL
jgi:hypothetical protein